MASKAGHLNQAMGQIMQQILQQSFFPRLGLTLLCLVSLSACPAETTDTSSSSSASTTLQPSASPEQQVLQAFTLATVSRNQLEPVATFNPESKAFGQAISTEEGEDNAKARLTALFPLQQTFDVYQNGQVVSQFVTETLKPNGCGFLPLLIGKHNPDQPEDFKGITYTSPAPIQPSPPPTLPTGAALQQMAETLKQRLFSDQGRESQQDQYGVDSIQPFAFQTAPGQPFKTGMLLTGRRKEDQTKSQYAVCGEELYWALGSFEQGNAVLHAGMFQPHSEDAEICYIPSLESSFVAQQALDHVLIHITGYEFWEYQIYAWQNKGFKEVFRGGGGGC